MNIIYENVVDKTTFLAPSEKVLVVTNRLIIKFVINLLYPVQVSLKSVGYESIPYRFSSTFEY